jgi:hypothetical protein
MRPLYDVFLLSKKTVEQKMDGDVGGRKPVENRRVVLERLMRKPGLYF